MKIFREHRGVFILSVAAVFVLCLAILLIISRGDYRAKKQIEISRFSQQAQLNVKNIDGYFQDLANNFNVLIGSNQTNEAMKDFEFGWEAIGHNQRAALKNFFANYSPDNDYPESDISSYEDANRIHSSWLELFLNKNAFSDIYLINLKGNIIYSAAKSGEFATNVYGGIWRETPLKKVFSEAGKAGQNSVVYTDYDDYAADGKAAFISAPLHRQGELMGVISARVNYEFLERILKNSNYAVEIVKEQPAKLEQLIELDQRYLFVDSFEFLGSKYFVTNQLNKYNMPGYWSSVKSAILSVFVMFLLAATFVVAALHKTLTLLKAAKFGTAEKPQKADMPEPEQQIDEKAIAQVKSKLANLSDKIKLLTMNSSIGKVKYGEEFEMIESELKRTAKDIKEISEKLDDAVKPKSAKIIQLGNARSGRKSADNIVSINKTTELK